ncbi:MAG TPA: glycosyltransferase family 4 protein [Spirochaetota bacterium]|nr:glycosyltransferase family 4 protein [Spirochaetota bacterium]HPS87426.1 glycosyltransferase family 4 protein [Spirochaetota bacterium]
MKICLLCYRGNPYSGGQGIYLKYVAEELVRQGHEVHAIVGPPYPHDMKGVVTHAIPNNEYYVKKGFNIINEKSPFDIFHPVNAYEWFHSRFGAFPEISSFGYRAFFLLRKLHAEYKFDIIHDNQSLNYGLLLMKSLGVPVVATIHHPLSIDLRTILERSESFRRKFRAVMFYPTLMQAIVSKRLDHIITVSEDSKIMNHRDFGVPLEKQSVVYNGIDRNIFKPVKVQKNKKDIIFVGNIEDGKKGFLYLLKAVKVMKTDVRLIVVDGGAPHRKVTNRVIDLLGIRDKIFFAGTASNDELVKLYSQSSAAIVPSVYEGFGFPAGEAMACGVPVISSDGGALPEVVGDAGIVVPARDHQALADAVDTLLNDPGMQKKFSGAGIERVKELFTWEGAVKQMVDVYSKL